MAMTALLGALVGLVMALTGAGGGVLAVPVLVFGLHLTVAQAGPVGLLAVGIAAAAGAILGLRAGLVRYRAAILMAISGALVAPAGVWLAHQLDTRMLAFAFAAVLLWIGARSLAEPATEKNTAAPPCARTAADGRFHWTRPCALALGATGAVAGLLSGLLGVGGGFVMVPALKRFSDLEPGSVIATSLAVIALISLAGVAASLAGGGIDAVTALPFAGGAAGGMAAGAVLAPRLPPRYVKSAFAVLCLAVALGMIFRSL